MAPRRARLGTCRQSRALRASECDKTRGLSSGWSSGARGIGEVRNVHCSARVLPGGAMSLRDKYAYAISTAKGKFDGSAQERDGKLHFVGSVKTEAEKNEIWTAIKTIPDWRNDIVADIKVTGGGSSSGGASTATATASKTYTVKAGDTLSKIAKQHLG